ncbi:MAG: GLPGLI family protein, partial [Chitinophagaceae bacterium]
MKQIVLTSLILVSLGSSAQQFISSGQIEFEVRTNNHKTFGDGMWAEMFRDKIPQFSTKYYTFTFDNNKALYKYERQDEKTKLPFSNNSDEDNI